MKGRTALGLALFVLGASGCFQEFDSGVTNGPPLSVLTPAGDGGDFLPEPFDGGDLAVALGKQPCAPGSTLCYQLCGSPSCTLIDNTIVPNLGTPVILEPDGGTTADSCADVEALSMQIRERSCAPCHEGTGSQAGLSYILEDQSLVTMLPVGVTTPVVKAGNPYGSLLFQRVANRINEGPTSTDTQAMPPPPSLASTILGSERAASLVYPNAEDLSILYAWILTCVPGADGGAFSSSYYGGNYGPGGDAGAPAPIVDAGGGG